MFHDVIRKFREFLYVPSCILTIFMSHPTFWKLAADYFDEAKKMPNNSDDINTDEPVVLTIHLRCALTHVWQLFHSENYALISVNTCLAASHLIRD